ncbi:MAG: hypothetical protein WA913_01710 [Pricia sp.]
MKNINRRNFIKTSSLATLGTLVASSSFASVIGDKGIISIVVMSEDVVANSEPANWAIGELKTALEKQGATVHINDSIEDADGFCVLVSQTNFSGTKHIMRKQNISVVPTEAESLCIVESEKDKRKLLLVSGTDASGLVYALTELADRVNCLETDEAALKFSEPVIERPASKTRSILKGFSSEIEDKVWFYDKEYWIAYLDMLVYSRLNRLNFSTGMAYNSVIRITDGYFVFPYPFFVDVNGYDVSVRGLSKEERERNLEILKFIGTETARRGLKFQFGIWTIAYNWDQGEPHRHSPDATYKTDGLTEENHADYCRDALIKLLREVPQISGVTFRVHEESGVALGTSSFWETQFSAVREFDRTIEIDMHAKNMEEKTLYTALATEQPVVVSPKFCGEHRGLPYHQSSIREFEMLEVDELVDKGYGLIEGNRKFSRYGYADMLSENRTWDVVYRVWPGTQRFLLSGDPKLYAGYGKTANFCNAKGFEICEPLHFKGRKGQGVPGGRCGYIDTTLKPRYDFEKYSYFFRLWGRLTYNPDTKPEVWRRALNQEFGQAGLYVEKALAQVTRVLPLFYTAHGVSANCVIYLPELYTNTYIAKEIDWPYDTKEPKTFGTISPMDPQLFHSPNEYAELIIRDEKSGKYTPIEVAQWLEDIAETASANIKEANELLGMDSKKPNFRRIEEDVLILVGLSRFFASKLRTAVLWKVYELSGDRTSAERAIELYENARNIWYDMAKRAENVYKKNIAYGFDSASGHWIDRVPSFDEDIDDLKNRLKNSPIEGTEVQKTIVDKARDLSLAKKPNRPVVEIRHSPKTAFQRGKPLSIALQASNNVERVLLYYRHVNQSEYWQYIELDQKGSSFDGEIPASFTDNRFPLQYYFEIYGTSEATLHPMLDEDLANVPYYVAHSNEPA